MKTNPKPFALFLLTALLLSSFTGCTGKDGEIYGQRKVLEAKACEHLDGFGL